MKSLFASIALAVSLVACGNPMPGNDAGSDSGSTPTDSGSTPTDSGSTGDGSSACLPTGNAANAASLLAGCGACHGTDLGGGTAIAGTNLHNEAMRAGSWTDCAFRDAMRTGMAPGGRTLCATMPRVTAAQMSDQQLADLLAHLRTLTTPGRTVGACM